MGLSRGTERIQNQPMKLDEIERLVAEFSDAAKKNYESTIEGDS
jgi:hypothetical protein